MGLVDLTTYSLDDERVVIKSGDADERVVALA
jgi:hypothetical protein